MLLAVQGTLKAGAAYVPMDSGYPDERISYILKDTKTKVVLTNEKYLDRLKSIMNSVEFVGIQPTTSADSVIPAKAGVQPPAILAIDSPELQRIVAEQSTENPNTVMSSRNLAYVIYTSGTTGNPKGVMLEHRGVVNRIKWMNDTYPLNEQDRILQKTPYVFDVSVWELFWAHWYGASIVFAKPEGHKDSNYLIELINEQGITVMHFVPSMLSVFEDTLEVEVEQKRVARENPP
jgi:non-ribosomal peptide synthetase component F